MSLERWLADLASSRPVEERDDALLWPRTPIGDEVQERIRERVGVSDHDVDDPRSRPARVARLIERLRSRGAVGDEPSIVDVACGDGLVLLELKRRMPRARCLGVDLNAGRFPAHARVRAAGVVVEPVLIQDLVTAAPPERLDVVLMLNTYRGWENADLPAADADLPERTDAWLRANARHVVVTARVQQLRSWRAAGWRVADLGRGEDDSRLVCLTRRRFVAGGVPAVRAAAVRWLPPTLAGTRRS